MNHHAVDCDRRVDFAGSIFVRTLMGHPGRKDRERPLAKRPRISNGTVDDDASSASRDGNRAHDFAN